MTDREDAPPESRGTELSVAAPRRRLHLHSESLADPLRENWAEPVHIDVDPVVRRDDGTTLQYWAVSHSDPDTLLERIESLPVTLDVTLRGTVGDRHWFEVHGSAESPLAVVEEFDGALRRASYDEAGADIVAEFPTDVDTETVVAALRAEEADLELVDSYTVETLDIVRNLVRSRLTDRQLTALQVAYLDGYYEQPRRRTGAELADRLDISKQAFHDHLRKAHAAVVEALVEDGSGPTSVDR